MSYITWESRSKSQNIPITSIRCLVDALSDSSIQLSNVPTEISELILAEKQYKSKLEAYKEATMVSLKEVEQFQQKIEALTQANQNLHDALTLAERNAPQSLTFHHNGITYTADKVVGSYKISWMEEIQKYDGRETGVKRGGVTTEAFVHQLCRTYENAMSRHADELRSLQSSMMEIESELPEVLAKAIHVRTAWERREERKRVDNLVKKRIEEVASNGESMGFTHQITELENQEETEIIISMERFVSTNPSGVGTNNPDQFRF